MSGIDTKSYVKQEIKCNNAELCQKWINTVQYYSE